MAVGPDRASFVGRFGGIYEHSPWVAERSFRQAALVATPGELADIFARCVDDADNDSKLALIRAHPDLAGKAAIKGELSEESTGEQASAGIDRCTPAEYEQFQSLNEQYRDKFGFPFVMAVRGRHRRDILSAFTRRLRNNYAAEFATAIDEIHKIAQLRLQAMMGDP